MTANRTAEGNDELRVEAERRVRAGESRADVSRDLGVPLSTLATWAHEGRWRKKDLEAERAQEVAGLIAETLRQEREQDEAVRAERRAKAIARAAAAGKPVAIPPGAPAPGLVRPDMFAPDPFLAERLAMSLAETLLKEGRLEEADRAVRFSVRFIAARDLLEKRSESRWAEEKELWKKWADATAAHFKNESDRRDSFYKENASRMADTLRRYAEDEQKLCASHCCPTCRQHVEVWPADDDGDEKAPATKIDGEAPAASTESAAEDGNVLPRPEVGGRAAFGERSARTAEPEGAAAESPIAAPSRSAQVSSGDCPGHLAPPPLSTAPSRVAAEAGSPGQGAHRRRAARRCDEDGARGDDGEEDGDDADEGGGARGAAACSDCAEDDASPAA